MRLSVRESLRCRGSGAHRICYLRVFNALVNPLRDIPIRCFSPCMVTKEKLASFPFFKVIKGLPSKRNPVRQTIRKQVSIIPCNKGFLSTSRENRCRTAGVQVSNGMKVSSHNFSSLNKYPTLVISKRMDWLFSVIPAFWEM